MRRERRPYPLSVAIDLMIAETYDERHTRAERNPV
jgi:hypothetical protein